MYAHQAVPVLKLAIAHTHSIGLCREKSFIVAPIKLIPNGSAIHTEGNL